MKKHITILLTAVLIFNLAACTSRKTEEMCIRDRCRSADDEAGVCAEESA